MFYLLISILISLLIIPAIVFTYFSFLFIILFFFQGGIKEQAILPCFTKKKKKLIPIWLMFFSIAIISIIIPVLWFSYI